MSFDIPDSDKGALSLRASFSIQRPFSKYNTSGKQVTGFFLPESQLWKYLPGKVFF